MALPGYLRNILKTALDRLSIVVNNVHVEMEDQTPNESPNESRSHISSPVSLHFHIERIAIDSMTVSDTRVDIDHAASLQDSNSKLGKRRLRVQNICARLISDAEKFVSMSRISRPSSPATNSVRGFWQPKSAQRILSKSSFCTLRTRNRTRLSRGYCVH